MPTSPTTHTEIGAFEAKTRLSEILRKVEQGERFTITRNGRAIADVIPSESGSPSDLQLQRKAALERFKNPKVVGISHETIRSWIEEGRE